MFPKEYLIDSYKFVTNATVISQLALVVGHKIKLSNTVFHPQGGGQPNDVGEILQGDIRFNIKSAEVDREDNLVWHIGQYISEATFEINSEVEVRISEESRRLHARIHSAGHLLDIAVQRLGYPLVPGKGFHFPEGSYVEYIGNIADRDEAMQNLNIVCERVIEEATHPVDVLMLSQEEAQKLFTVPKQLAEDQNVRFVRLTPEDKGCPCGGTHVKHVQEIGRITVTKLQKKGKNLRVSYKVE